MQENSWNDSGLVGLCKEKRRGDCRVLLISQYKLVMWGAPLGVMYVMYVPMYVMYVMLSLIHI